MPQNESVTLTPFTRQGHHVAGFLIMFLLLHFLSLKMDTNVIWPIFAFLSAVLHQGLVVVVWRAELFGSNISRMFNAKGFYLYGILFFLLFLLRFISTVGAAIDASRTFYLPYVVLWPITGTIFIFFIWAQVSVFTYFGVKRALGADHFYPEYRDIPFVRQGIFKYTSNGMYAFGLLGFMLPGLFFQSGMGLAVGLFHYLAVWLHYWATELPDMKYIYRNR
ncbi:MAG: phosphatidylethanolamine N-methyltransferase family protein [Firmicutes bacterium]|nr:phosphatidylethanolamine N-methyltransferase family protein [Bacillota bacterium]